ncbi:MAG: YitT family protein [Clostridiales bacterium]|nr:YitT family protein [Clostridiales bacterium]
MGNDRTFRDYALIIIGAFIMGFAIKNIYDPAGLVTGGFSGIAIIVKDRIGVPLWLTNTALNVPLFLAAYRMKGWEFIRGTLVATVALSVSLYILPEVVLWTDDLFLSALFGGLASGVGIGLVFICSATTGGTDMLAALIRRWFPQYSLAQIMQLLDAAIVLAGAGIFGLHYALYALIAIYAVTKVSDGIIEGLKFSKAAYIISDKSEVIAAEIMTKLGRGVTSLDATGMYSGTRKNMLMCVVSKKEIVQLKELVVGQDSQAFVIVTDVREVLGEGFMEFRQ